ncbi:MAG TPA: two-component sensor histidine kinase [Micromonosporaceae bacterium]|nr:two-component sensor histidine kinase [Micromonosporaceae bacterium]HCU48236.1 two-component sensor histidine kinase [Micromonosporaceae bacterium]
MTSSSPPPSRARRGFGLALLATLVQTIGTTIAAVGQSAKLDLLGYALLAASGLMLANRHRLPGTTLVVTAAATVAYHVLDYPSGPTFVALVIAALAAMKAGHHGKVWATAIISLAAWAVLTGAAFGEVLTLAAWVAGLGLFAEIVLGAAKAGGKMAQEQRRLRQERRRRQASEERLRIAHELHDVLGHHLSLINVRAAVGLHLMDRQPDQARAALDTIKQASAESLREVQSVLNALYPTGEGAPRAPAPGLDRLDDLTVDAGLPVHTTMGGEPRPLPAEIDRAAYRVIQEALTNVRRHAGPGASAKVVIEYQPEDQLLVQIEDDGGVSGPVSATFAEGNGISGMRERASTLGGSLTAQPLPEGGWRVRALFPLPAQENAQ